jgi:hypothetical protein
MQTVIATTGNLTFTVEVDDDLTDDEIAEAVGDATDEVFHSHTFADNAATVSFDWSGTKNFHPMDIELPDGRFI